MGYGALLFALFISTQSFSATLLPYSNRTQNYSAWTPAIQSDTNTTGMAGATVALPSSISSAEVNPAGFAMETGSLSAQINRISITDRKIQPDGQSIDSTQWGLGLSPPPWGFSISYYSPITESDTYTSAITSDPLKTEVSFKEFRFTIARTFFDSMLAIGVSAELDKAVRELGPYSYDAYAPSFALGALYRAQSHMVFGASYIPPLTIQPTNQPDNNELPGFNRAVLRPSQLNLGVGWIPNRFFKAGVSLAYVGDTANTALLYDQTITTGATPTWVPRAGASYVWAQFKNFSSEFAAGSYYAPSRLAGEAGRLHATTGLDVNPYFVNLGLGFDLSEDYHNVMIGLGIDIVRTLRTFHIIPMDPTPPLNGYFPPPNTLSADGLPDALTHGEKKNTSPPTFQDVTHIIENTPQNVINKMEGVPTSVEREDQVRRKHRKKSHKKMERTPLPTPTPIVSP